MSRRTDRKALGDEILQNMSLDKGQYLAVCGIIDDLGLVKDEPEPSWEDITKEEEKS